MREMSKEKRVIVSDSGLKFLTMFFYREFDGITPDDPADCAKVFVVKETKANGLSDLVAAGIVTGSIDYHNTKNENFKVFAFTELGQSLLAEGLHSVKTATQLDLDKKSSSRAKPKG